MAGLRNICRMHGAIIASDGTTTVKHVWDYANECPVNEKDMPVGSQRWRASEKAKWEEIKKHWPPKAEGDQK